MTIHQILTTEPAKTPRPSFGLPVDVFTFAHRSYNVVKVGRWRVGFYTYHFRWTFTGLSLWRAR